MHKLTIVVSTACCLLLAPLARADQASTLYHQAMAYKKLNKYGKAIGKLKEALVVRPDYAAVHRSLGILYRKQRKFNKAIHHLERAAKLQPGAAQVFYSLGLAYHAAGHRKKALAALDKAATLAPKNAQLVAGLGTLLIRLDPERALRHLHQANKLEPQNGNHLHQLGLAYRKAAGRAAGLKQQAKSKKYMKNAEKYLLQATAFADDNARLHFDLGVYYRRIEETTKAIRHYRRAVELDAKFAAAWWDLGHMYKHAKRNEEAIKAYEKYLQIRGGAKDAWVARKRIQELKKK